MRPFSAVVCVCVCVGPLLPYASAQKTRDLADASLEELMEIRVSSVSRKEQRLSQTAAAVYVVTHDDIARSGVTSVPEALRMVPGLQVARIDSSKWAISARGFNGHFSNKMLVLIDGRSIYTNLYSGVFWDQYDVMLEDIERIEVVRGPGGTMWGANAVNGVINIITRKAKDTQGTMFVAGTGNEDFANTAVRHGGRWGDRIQYRGFAKFFNRNEMLSDTGLGGGDSWHQGRVGGRADVQLNERDSLSLMGDGYSGQSRSTIYTGYPLPQQGELLRQGAEVGGGFGLGRWTRTMSERSEFTLSAYVNHEQRAEYYGRGAFRQSDLDFQHRLKLRRRHDFLWGAGYRMSQGRVDASNRGITFDPPGRTDHLYSSFAQDDFSIKPDRLVVTLGSKFLHNTYSGFEVQPTLRMLWTPNRDHGFWGAISRAVRTPSRLNHDLRVPFPVQVPGGLPATALLRGDRSFGSETLRAAEAGFRRQFGKFASVDVALFQNSYAGLAEFVAGDPEVRLSPTPSVFILLRQANGGRRCAHGVEVASALTPWRRWRLQTNYSWLSMPDPGGTTAASTNNTALLRGFVFAQTAPSHSLQAHSSLELHRRLSWDLSFYRVGQLSELQIPGYTRVDWQLTWKANERYALSGGLRNALDPQHTEFRPEDFVRATNMRRAYFLQLTRRF